MNDTILRAMQMVEFTKRAADSGVRATVPIFPIDEISDMDDIAATVDALGPGVDWVLIKNKVKTPRTRMFDGSELERELDGFRGPSGIARSAFRHAQPFARGGTPGGQGDFTGGSPAQPGPQDGYHSPHRPGGLAAHALSRLRGHRRPFVANGRGADGQASIEPAVGKKTVRRGAKINRANIE